MRMELLPPRTTTRPTTSLSRSLKSLVAKAKFAKTLRSKKTRRLLRNLMTMTCLITRAR